MERERLVDGPHPPAGLALPERGQGRPDGGRVVPVVVVDHHPGRLAHALEPPADAREGRRDRRRSADGPPPAPAPAPATPSAFWALWRPGRGEPRRGDVAPRVPSPTISRVVVAGSAAATRPTSAVRGSTGRCRCSRADPGAAAAASCSAPSTSAVATSRPGQSAQPLEEPDHARVRHVGDQDRRRRPRSSHPAAAPEPASRRPTRPRRGRRRRPDDPSPPTVRTAIAGRYGVEVAGVFVGLHHEHGSAADPGRRGQVRRSRSTGGAPPRTRTDPRRPRPGDGPASRPRCSCRGCRPRRRGSGRQRRRRQSVARARWGCRPPGRPSAPDDPGWWPSGPSSPPGGSAPARLSRALGSCAQSIWMPAASRAAVYGDGPPASQPVTAAPAAAPGAPQPRRPPRPRPPRGSARRAG